MVAYLPSRAAVAEIELLTGFSNPTSLDVLALEATLAKYTDIDKELVTLTSAISIIVVLV